MDIHGTRRPLEQECVPKQGAIIAVVCLGQGLGSAASTLEEVPEGEKRCPSPPVSFFCFSLGLDRFLASIVSIVSHAFGAFFRVSLRMPWRKLRLTFWSSNSSGLSSGFRFPALALPAGAGTGLSSGIADMCISQPLL